MLKTILFCLATFSCLTANEFPTCDEICTTLEKDFYVKIPIEVSRPMLEDTVDAFLEFLKTDTDVKTHLKSLLPGHHRRRELGFMFRDTSDNDGLETKEFFHYHPYLLKEHSEFIASDPVVNNFIIHMDGIWNLVADTAKDMLKRLDERFPGTHDGVFDTAEPHIMLRLVYYKARPDQQILARPHFDAGSFTLAVAESAPGLRIGSNQENLTLVPYEPNRMIFMLGRNCQQMLPSKSLVPAWHDVIRLNDLNTRWAIVAFIDGHSVPSPSREDTHQVEN